MNFGSIPVVTAIVLPLSGIYYTFNVYVLTFRKILFTNFGSFVSYNYVMPFCIGDFFVGLFIGIGFVCGQRKTTNTVPTIKIVHFHFISQMTNKHDFI